MPIKPHKKRIIIGLSLLLIAILCASIGYAWFHIHPSVMMRPQQPIATPTFKPVVGDVNDPADNDQDITIQQQLIPGFQFQHGGYELSGKVTDTQSGQPVFSAVVWIDLPVQQGRPTSTPLHTVTDATGSYQFAHLAPGMYTVLASRYNNVGDGHYYAERIFSSVALANNRFGLLLPLTPILVPGKRSIS